MTTPDTAPPDDGLRERVVTHLKAWQIETHGSTDSTTFVRRFTVSELVALVRACSAPELDALREKVARLEAVLERAKDIANRAQNRMPDEMNAEMRTLVATVEAQTDAP